jgi:hypothetical protein
MVVLEACVRWEHDNGHELTVNMFHQFRADFGVSEARRPRKAKGTPGVGSKLGEYNFEDEGDSGEDEMGEDNDSVAMMGAANSRSKHTKKPGHGSNPGKSLNSSVHALPRGREEYSSEEGGSGFDDDSSSSSSSSESENGSSTSSGTKYRKKRGSRSKANRRRIDRIKARAAVMRSVLTSNFPNGDQILPISRILNILSSKYGLAIYNSIGGMISVKDPLKKQREVKLVLGNPNNIDPRASGGESQSFVGIVQNPRQLEEWFREERLNLLRTDTGIPPMELFQRTQHLATYEKQLKQRVGGIMSREPSRPHPYHITKWAAIAMFHFYRVTYAGTSRKYSDLHRGADLFFDSQIRQKVTLEQQNAIILEDALKLLGSHCTNGVCFTWGCTEQFCYACQKGADLVLKSTEPGGVSQSGNRLSYKFTRSETDAAFNVWLGKQKTDPANTRREFVRKHPQYGPTETTGTTVRHNTAKTPHSMTKAMMFEYLTTRQEIIPLIGQDVFSEY